MKNANLVWRFFSVLGLVTGVVVALGCGSPEPEAPPEPKPIAHWFSIDVGAASVDMQLAVTRPEMQRGLMGRRDLESNQGMLFVYPVPSQMSFWMRNTPTPLDIAFFTSDGTLRETYKLHPFDERPVRSRRSDLQYALEVVQGGLERMGIKPGDRLDLAAVSRALEDRGFEPNTYRGLTASGRDSD